MRRPALYLALLPLVAVPAVGAFAQAVDQAPPSESAASAPAQPQPAAVPEEEVQQEPAPGGEAAAVAATVDGVVAIGETHAQAGPDSAEATGNAVAVGGEPLIADTTGGTATAGESTSGALFDTEETELGRLALTPWAAQAESGDGTSSSSAEAALLRAHLMDLLAIDVLASQSEAQYTTARSSGASSSDGAVVDLGGGQLVVRVLHAEASSENGGSSYLLGVNENQIATSDDANGQCVLTIPSLIDLSCLTATGGEGEDAATAAVVTAVLAEGQLPTVVVSGAAARGTEGEDTEVLGGNVEQPAETAPVTQAAVTPSTVDTLAFTGAHTGLLAAAAGLLLAAGAALLRFGRREHQLA